ncbi:MAG TPA: hypothetical protein PKD12_23745 [Nitrospira sp.]|nr:hypothetical protein [Nitrospira sp.]
MSTIIVDQSGPTFVGIDPSGSSRERSRSQIGVIYYIERSEQKEQSDIPEFDTS